MEKPNSGALSNCAVLGETDELLAGCIFTGKILSINYVRRNGRLLCYAKNNKRLLRWKYIADVERRGWHCDLCANEPKEKLKWIPIYVTSCVLGPNFVAYIKKLAKKLDF